MRCIDSSARSPYRVHMSFDISQLLEQWDYQPGQPAVRKFIGKDGVSLDLPVTDSKIAGMLRDRAKSAGKNGQLFPNVSNSSLLDYMHEFDGGKFKTKDFRTRLGTAEAKMKMSSLSSPKTERDYKRSVREVAVHVSSILGNTPTIALQSYIHPAVFASWRAAL